MRKFKATQARGCRTCGRIRGFLVGLVFTVLTAHPLRAQVAPDETWRTLTTEHFRVTFPENLEELGRRAASRAERAYTGLARAFVDPPGGHIDLLVTDNVDVSNGFARVTPSNRIVVYARPPVDDPGLGYFDDWMDLVVTHELAHVFHLDRTGTPGRVVRAVLGRVPSTWPAFPGLGVPRWTTEGLATWYVSFLSDAGRVRGAYHDMVLRTAALEGRFEGLGQASGRSPQWPAGDRAYAYGSLFFDHLVDEHGEERMGAFVEAVAGQWIPYRLDAAGRKAFGAPLSEEWSRWSAMWRARADSLRAEASRSGFAEPEQLTQRARRGLYARVSPDGRTLAYARADGRSDSQIRIARADGSEDVEFTRANGVGTFDWTPDGGLVLSQLERVDPYRTFADLYRVDPEGGQLRLTLGRRLTHPSVEPGGEWAVAVEEGSGTSALVRVDLSDGEVSRLVAPEADVHWSFPAVSPDGRWIAASRWTPGAHLDVVILDRKGEVAVQVTDDRAMDVAPAWAPGGDFLLWGSDRSGIPNVLAVPFDPTDGRVGAVVRVTDVATGASFPSVDPGSEWVYLSGYHAEGWEVERVPFDPASWPPAGSAVARFAASKEPVRTTEAAAGQVESYSAWPTLAPQYWEPIYREAIVTAPVQTEEVSVPSRELLGPAVGAETSGFDLVGRHSYDAFARVFTRGGKVDAGLSYSFAGLGNPVLSFGVSQLWGEDGPRLGQRDEGVSPDTLFVRFRERSVSAAVTLLRPRWRHALSLTLSTGLTFQHFELLDDDLRPATAFALSRPDPRFADTRLTLTFTTARAHALQLGASDGVSLFLRGRVKGELSLPDSLVGELRRDRSVDEVLGSFRVYRTLGGPGHASHVVAARVGFGAARGPGADAGFFDVGGASGSQERITGLTLFGGSPLFFPVRGYPRSFRIGRVAWSATAEYRFPLALVNRGLGAWPLHLDRVVGAIFVDGGNAWGPELGVAGFQNPRRSTLASIGAEVTSEWLALWTDPLRLRTGIAAPLGGGGGVRVYVRVGLSF